MYFCNPNSLRSLERTALNVLDAYFPNKCLMPPQEFEAEIVEMHKIQAETIKKRIAIMEAKLKMLLRKSETVSAHVSSKTYQNTKSSYLSMNCRVLSKGASLINVPVKNVSDLQKDLSPALIDLVSKQIRSIEKNRRGFRKLIGSINNNIAVWLFSYTQLVV